MVVSLSLIRALYLFKAEGTVIDPISGKPKQFLLKGIGDTYTVTVTKTGYTTQAKQVKNDGDKTLTVVLQAEATGT